ncbi:hypothetical protein BZG36_00589, partial [Bifiguratus adelaidae]
ICIDSVEQALVAEVNGASRVELCDNLLEGGTTPSAGNDKTSVSYGLPPPEEDVAFKHGIRGGDFVYTEMDFYVMKEDIKVAKQLGADGVVIGALTPSGDIDVPRMKELLEVARPMSVTFHRAFDLVRDPIQAAEQLMELGVDRILTSGHKRTAVEGLDLLVTLRKHCDDRIIIMPGSGVNASNVRQLVDTMDPKEIHLSAAKLTASSM